MKNIGIINGLRGYAIIAVIYHHLFFSYTMPGYKAFEFAGFTIFPLTYFSNGWLGVNLFFILSGFVLSYPYLLNKRGFNSKEDIKKFYVHRAKRLLPLYYLSSVISIIFITHHADSMLGFVKEMFLLVTVTFNFTGDTYFPRYNWLLWSLGIEIWFSIAFPLIIVLIKKYGLINILFSVLLLSLLTRIIGNNDVFYTSGSTVVNPVKDSLLGRLDEFVWGIFLCHMYIHKVNKFTQTLTWGSFFSGIALITAACLLWDNFRLNLLSRSFLPYINIILDFGFVLLAVSLLAMKKNLVSWIFTNYFMQLLGVMCYSLYVWHGIALKTFLDTYTFAHITGYFFMLLILSGLSYRYIEFGSKPDTRQLFLINKST